MENITLKNFLNHKSVCPICDVNLGNIVVIDGQEVDVKIDDEYLSFNYSNISFSTLLNSTIFQPNCYLESWPFFSLVRFCPNSHYRYMSNYIDLFPDYSHYSMYIESFDVQEDDYLYTFTSNFTLNQSEIHILNINKDIYKIHHFPFFEINVFPFKYPDKVLKKIKSFLILK